MDTVLEVQQLSKTYSSASGAVPAIGNMTFEINRGEFCCVVGPSGCGKTTLLKCLAGLTTPTSGTASLRGVAIREPPSSMAVVFQDYSRSLLPWMSVLKNVALPLRSKGMTRAEREAVAAEKLAAVGLEQRMHLYPWQLSGGMQQRVAIARALAYQPEILLMDEPFASVDAQTRADLEDLLLQIWSEFGGTILFVTHDIDESVYLADRVLVLTPSPTEVKEVVSIDLPRPRDQVTSRDTMEFAHLRTLIYQLVRGQPTGAAKEERASTG